MSLDYHAFWKEIDDEEELSFVIPFSLWISRLLAFNEIHGSIIESGVTMKNLYSPNKV